MFYVGLDLGQTQDYTALAIIESVDDEYHCRHLERFKLGTPYPAVVQRLKDLTGSKLLRRKYVLVADATGVGRPVLDMLRLAGLHVVGIFITAGHEVAFGDGNYHVPKRDLVSTVQVLLQNGQLKFAESLPEVATLVKELLAFQVKISADAHDTYGAWREGAHDDLVLAVALACWYAKYHGGPSIILI